MQKILLISVAGFTAITADCRAQVNQSQHFPKDFQTTAIASVVRITDLSQDTSGTGYIVGRRRSNYYILTGWHVVDGVTSGSNFRVTFSPFTTADRTDAVEILAYSKGNDCALLTVRHAASYPSLKICTPKDLPESRFPVMAVGFPDGQLTCHESLALKSERFTSDQHDVDGQFWCIRDRSAGGISGAPLLISCNGEPAVIGSWWGSSGDEGRCSHLDEIHRFVKGTDHAWLLNRPLVTIRVRQPFAEVNRSLSSLLLELDQLPHTGPKL